jgi:hypothetical protein
MTMLEFMLVAILVVLVSILFALPKQQVPDPGPWLRLQYENADYRPAKPYLAEHSPQGVLPRYRVTGDWSKPQGIVSHHDNWMDALAVERRLNDAERPAAGYCGEPRPPAPSRLREWLFWLGMVPIIIGGIAAYCWYLNYLGLD